MKVKVKQYVHDHIVDEFNHQHLKPNKIYEVIGIDHDSYRVIDEAGEPILYPKALFEIIDPLIPTFWIRKAYSSDEYYIDPPGLDKPGFYEDYFDGKPEAIATFQKFAEITIRIQTRRP